MQYEVTCSYYCLRFLLSGGLVMCSNKTCEFKSIHVCVRLDNRIMDNGMHNSTKGNLRALNPFTLYCWHIKEM
jgi:hypothetical protein